MKTTSWIVWGLGLTCVAGMVHSGTPDAGEPMAAAYASMPALLIGAVGQFCLWRGLRSAMGDVWGGLTARKYREGQSGSAAGRAAQDEPQSDFDADAAFARYMEQRAAQEQEQEQAQAAQAASPAPARAPAAARAPAPARPGPVPRPRAPGGFGRRVV